MLLVLIWTACAVLAAYLILRQRYSHFSRKGVQYLPPALFLGNLAATTFRREHLRDTLKRLYDSFPTEKYVGFFEFTTPVVLVRDPELAKQITVKDFDHFLDHRVRIDENVEPLFGRNLFALKGQKWRDMRSTLSPAFTASKMKNMYNFIAECAQQMAEGLATKSQEQGEKYLELEMKDLCTRYANDVIASCAFGLKVDSVADQDNNFYAMGKDATDFSGITLLKFLGYSSFPALMKFFKLTIISSKVTKFFRNLVQDTMANRRENHIVRPDMIHLLMEAKKGNLKHETKESDTSAGFATVDESVVGTNSHKRVWADDDLTAQALLFFIAGFDTSATLMSFLAYELAANPEVQRRLQKEIEGLKCDYETVQRMEYMDMVVSECLRKWSPAVITDRLCTKPYTLGPTRDGANNSITLQVGDGIWIMVQAIHHDPAYWPEPENFDPERFSNENKHNIKPFTYMPFGSGPRNCIGSRFALLETKTLLMQLLAKFDLEPSPRMTVPLELETDNFNLRVKNGCWVRLRKRTA